MANGQSSASRELTPEEFNQAMELQQAQTQAQRRWMPYAEITQQYGLPQYQQALAGWQKAYGDYAKMMGQVSPALQQMMGYYAPGGGYGAGERQEAAETVQGGVAGDIGSMVASGMSSGFGARGVQTRAGSELSKLYKNIEDTRSQLWQQSVQPYAQMMDEIAKMQTTRPTYGQYVRPVTTTQYAYG